MNSIILYFVSNIFEGHTQKKNSPGICNTDSDNLLLVSLETTNMEYQRVVLYLPSKTGKAINNILTWACFLLALKSICEVKYELRACIQLLFCRILHVNGVFTTYASFWQRTERAATNQKIVKPKELPGIGLTLYFWSLRPLGMDMRVSTIINARATCRLHIYMSIYSFLEILKTWEAFHEKRSWSVQEHVGNLHFSGRKLRPLGGERGEGTASYTVRAVWHPRRQMVCFHLSSIWIPKNIWCSVRKGYTTPSHFKRPTHCRIPFRQEISSKIENFLIWRFMTGQLFGFEKSFTGHQLITTYAFTIPILTVTPSMIATMEYLVCFSLGFTTRWTCEDPWRA